ncbi:eukaryotic translation initiation factor 2B delta subunit [Lentinula aciculospora]|uniref:Translation initiation factor eIF2B subunit delta n=1 Tax=Lentinula aciculospora TaxID=153920 RepID=A0A9W9A1A8_9AGAR|nr:eukaryotic translation initiation factor 2B delta subunit [Lentinula aciculospora]
MPQAGPKYEPASAEAQSLTKAQKRAEGRARQEQQRAAKAAQKQQPQSGLGAPGTTGSSSSKSKGTVPKKPVSESNKTPSAAASSSKDAPTTLREGAGGLDGLSDGPKSRGLRIFSHFGLPKTPGHQIKGDIHPAIVKLGLQFSEFKICGANARCIATLTAFKMVIQDYVTPPHNTLSRHLMTHLSPQITHLVTARPMSVTMGNAIRQLKLEISGSDIDLPEQDAKDALCQKIDNYIRDRIIIADEVIEDLAVKKIKDEDVVLTYARSSLVEKIILRAHSLNKRFSVIVVDSRPLLEGKALLHSLTSTVPPIPCTYALLPALPSLITDADIVLLGAHSLHANGSVYSRAGTAMVAMLAKEHTVPVMLCCETYKFSETVMLDGFGKNELAPTKFSPASPKSNSNLEVLNPLYDSTPASCITAVVTEVGLIPPTSISSIPLALGRTTL